MELKLNNGNPVCLVALFVSVIALYSPAIAAQEAASAVTSPVASPVTSQEATPPAPLTLGVSYDYDDFDRDLDPWRQYQLSLSKSTSLGSLTGKINQAERFGETGTQGEVDLYPSLGEGKYAYLNVGYSNSDIFPEWRTGAEYFQSLPGKTEASLGFRLLQFSGEPVKIFTGSASKYWGSFLFTLRPYYVPDTIGDSWSGSFSVKYYLNDEESIGVSTGTGVATAEDVNLQIFEQHSQKVGVDGKFKVSDRVFVLPGASVQWFEFFPGIYRRQESFGIKLQFLL